MPVDLSVSCRKLRAALGLVSGQGGLEPGGEKTHTAQHDETSNHRQHGRRTLERPSDGREEGGLRRPLSPLFVFAFDAALRRALCAGLGVLRGALRALLRRFLLLLQDLLGIERTATCDAARGLPRAAEQSVQESHLALLFCRSHEYRIWAQKKPDPADLSVFRTWREEPTAPREGPSSPWCLANSGDVGEVPDRLPGRRDQD